MCSHLRARSAAPLASMIAFVALLTLALTASVPSAAHADQRAARSAPATSWSAFLWPRAGQSCTYAPLSSISTPAAKVRVTQRTRTKVAVALKAASASARETYTVDRRGRLRLRVNSITAGGTTLRASESILIPTLAKASRKKSVTSTVAIRASLPPAQAAQVKPYLTSGSTVNLAVTFKVSGLGARTVQGYDGVGLAVRITKVRTTNVVAAAQPTVLGAATGFLRPLAGVQWYGKGFGLVAFGGVKKNGTDGLVLSGCS